MLPGSLEEKLAAAARAGIQSVDLSGGRPRESQSALPRLLRSFRLGVGAIAGGRLPGAAGRDSLPDGLEKSIEFARELGASHIVVEAGPDAGGDDLTESCRRAADRAAKDDLIVAIAHHGESGLPASEPALRFVREVNHPHLRLLFDLYEEQTQSGNLIRAVREAAGDTAIFKIADCPSREEPGSGEIYFPNVYKAIGESGFDGQITFDYNLRGDPVRSLVDAADSMRAALG
jgi:hydroxypyruvate isomerase